MSTFLEHLKILRRFLRDPDALIWSNETLRLFWNQSAIELSQKVGLIDRAHAYRWPPSFTYSYTYDWEREFLEGDLYRCFEFWHAGGVVCTYPWEPGADSASNMPGDQGYRYTHPFEIFYGAPGDPVRVPLHQDLVAPTFAAFDEYQIAPITERELAQTDPNYKTVSGSRPLYYYRPDTQQNEAVIYPRPSMVSWSEEDIRTGPGVAFDDAGGIIIGEDGALDETDYGIITEEIPTLGHLFMIFNSLPPPVEDYEDVIDWDLPPSIAAVRYGTLERAFGANTDGFIPSLRDYWHLRKEASIKALKIQDRMQLTDRDFRLGGDQARRQVKPHLRLPSSYPEQWP